MENHLALFTHIYQSRGNKTFVLFHGTGGDEYDLFPIAEEMNDSYSILSLRGNVQEHGMNRFFERYSDMTFNIESTHTETEKLHTFLHAFIKKYNTSFDDLIFVGYSNGANFALSFQLIYPNLVKHSILLHPMLPFKPKEDIALNETHMLITYGKHDPYSTEKEMKSLKHILEESNANTHYFEHAGGHEIQAGELIEAQQFIKIPITHETS